MRPKISPIAQLYRASAVLQVTTSEARISSLPGHIFIALYYTTDYKKAVLSQRWPRNAPYMGALKIFGNPWLYAHGNYSQHFHGLLFRSTLWMFLQNMKSVALPVREIIGSTREIWAVPGYGHARFSPKFLMGFYSDWSCKCTRQIWSS